MATPSKETKTQEQQTRQQEQSHARQQEPARAQETSPVPYRGAAPARYGGGWEPLARLRDEFDRMFDHFLRGWPAVPAGRWDAGGHGGWDLDVREEGDDVVVRAEAPGFEPGEFDVQVRGDQLILRAAHKAEAGGKDEGYREWRRHEFFRTVPLGTDVDADKVKANYRHGVLTVTLPKSDGGKGRKITVEG